MYAKVFRQILDSSIAENYRVRHVFEDLLKLANVDGIVDMTVQAVARAANMPFEEVDYAIKELLKPDPESRTPDFKGCRIVLLEPDKRSWGWMIVNYQKYRDMQDEEMRRAAFREAKQKQREKERLEAEARAAVVIPSPVKGKRGGSRKGKPLPGEQRFADAVANGATEEELERIVDGAMPGPATYPPQEGEEG